jgi:hypothetical protein
MQQRSDPKNAILSGNGFACVVERCLFAGNTRGREFDCDSQLEYFRSTAVASTTFPLEVGHRLVQTD